MTEDEAKTKWCPFVRLCTPHLKPAPAAVYNRLADGNDTATSGPQVSCIASACMAWRNFTLDQQSREGGPVGGYCGLAGQLQ